ncbi:rhomboid-like protein [Raineyella fluvialis]|uniref:Rhomboid family protein n=1 Tax=Raineyella fluvialis TaxID=2662261 RepID=A0A5Q2FJ70_9ACTN|nr:rhomboid-like protein [Raineyella fluvialis]QGF24705.1 hypothetical protein Rai3103_14880 [Raineyella fluvialis]
MILLLLIVVGVLGRLGQRRRWRWSVGLVEQWHRLRPPVWTWVRTAPLTYSYLGLLAFTTWLLVRTDTGLRTAFLAAQSTNLHELSINPIPVLLRSVFYVTPLEFAMWVVAFTVVLAPLERWIGVKRWLIVFWAGHIGATLVTAVAVAWGVGVGRLPTDVAFVVDVGASYGFAALLGLAGYWFGGRTQWLWAAVLTLIWMMIFVLAPQTTNAGHLVAFLLGVAMRPLVRGLHPRTPVLSSPSV